MRYKLRTLLILLAVLPPLLWVGWTKYAAWKAEQERRKAEYAAWKAEQARRPQSVKVPDGGTVLLGGLKQPTAAVPEEPRK